jgi:uncharacterized membrane protein YeaQ/YmgE (transglycosylase-associated protein family)
MMIRGVRSHTPKGGREVDLNISLGLGGWSVVIIGALVIGVVAQFIGETRTGFEWLVVAIGAAIGAVVASEFIVDMRTFEPVWDGLALVPALVGGLIVGVVVDAVTRYSTGGRYFGHPMAA